MRRGEPRVGSSTRWPLGPEADIDELRGAARAFAELTHDLDDLPPPALCQTIAHFHDFSHRSARLATAAAADRSGRAGRAGILLAEAGRLSERLERELANVRADSLPVRIVHNDAKLDNVLVDSTTGSVACIVDLDTVMAGTVLNDFGELARTAATTGPEDEPDVSRIELDHERFAALAEGTLAARLRFLLESERECLALAGPLLTLENAVRFLTDHLDGDVYFRVRHVDHNAERARSQLRTGRAHARPTARSRDQCGRVTRRRDRIMTARHARPRPRRARRGARALQSIVAAPLLRAPSSKARSSRPTSRRCCAATRPSASSRPVPGEPDGYIRLLLVDPAHRGKGHGHTLLAAAQGRPRREQRRSPSAPTRPTTSSPASRRRRSRSLCLLEKHRYTREEANFNMEVDLARIPPDPGGTTLATAAERDEVADWMARALGALAAPRCCARSTRARCSSHATTAGITGFCAWNVNRDGLLGPIASRPDLVGKSIGRPLLLGALHRMRAAGAATIEVAWVGPIRPYARSGRPHHPRVLRLPKAADNDTDNRPGDDLLLRPRTLDALRATPSTTASRRSVATGRCARRATGCASVADGRPHCGRRRRRGVRARHARATRSRVRRPAADRRRRRLARPLRSAR